jgi:hypothetical protein
MAFGVSDHAAKSTGVHGLPTGYYFARTTRPDGRIALKDILGEWDVSQFDIDWSSVRLDGGLNIDRGTLKIAYLPVAAPGETSSTKVVRADDPRLASESFRLTTHEPIGSGEWVSLINDGGVTKARKALASHDTGAIGFAGAAAGLNETVQVYTTGENTACYLQDATSADIGATVYVSGVAGRASRTPAQNPGDLIQPLGTVIRVLSATVVTVLIRFEYRFRL